MREQHFKSAGGCETGAAKPLFSPLENMRKWGAGLKPADFIIFSQRVDAHIYT
jgi:hypothetical protein